MDQNNAAFPPPPFWYKRGLKTPPNPPIEGEFSMFGRVFTTKEAPLRIEAENFVQMIPETELQDPATFNKETLLRLEYTLYQSALNLIKTLAESPMDAPGKFKDYEQIILNFYQLIYWMRPTQCMVEIKNRLRDQISEKEKEKQELKEVLENMLQVTSDIENIKLV
ncbi:unnamed protein product [Blepharisma stoltei]|uniref:Mediator of RNA polymerase II transcription subunit 7 n=1 Tax=Blepharisma stoltei TaxID=1481888 RepID=A0AAU9IED8_9CILI|nr:unnamed protein product [Blepharisma stoltei]